MANWEKEDWKDRRANLEARAARTLKNLNAEQIAKLPTEELRTVAVQIKMSY